MQKRIWTIAYFIILLLAILYGALLLVSACIALNKSETGLDVWDVFLDPIIIVWSVLVSQSLFKDRMKYYNAIIGKDEPSKQDAD